MNGRIVAVGRRISRILFRPRQDVGQVFQANQGTRHAMQRRALLAFFDTSVLYFLVSDWKKRCLPKNNGPEKISTERVTSSPFSRPVSLAYSRFSKNQGFLPAAFHLLRTSAHQPRCPVDGTLPTLINLISKIWSGSRSLEPRTKGQSNWGLGLPIFLGFRTWGMKEMPGILFSLQGLWISTNGPPWRLILLTVAAACSWNTFCSSWDLTGLLVDEVLLQQAFGQQTCKKTKTPQGWSFSIVPKSVDVDFSCEIRFSRSSRRGGFELLYISPLLLDMGSVDLRDREDREWSKNVELMGKQA